MKGKKGIEKAPQLGFHDHQGDQKSQSSDLRNDEMDLLLLGCDLDAGQESEAGEFSDRKFNVASIFSDKSEVIQAASSARPSAAQIQQPNSKAGGASIQESTGDRDAKKQVEDSMAPAEGNEINKVESTDAEPGVQIS